VYRKMRNRIRTVCVVPDDETTAHVSHSNVYSEILATIWRHDSDEHTSFALSNVSKDTGENMVV
jgi:hypothetical protein